MTKSATWQHRKADSDEERFGLLDKATLPRYKKMPLFQEPKSDLPKKEMTAMGITSGVGSMLVGAHNLGFNVVGNVEWRDYYRYRTVKTGHSTFMDNFPGAYMARGLNDVPSGLLPSSIDFIAGHPECGRFSSLSHSVSLGTYKDSRTNDPSDIPLFLKMIAQLRPRFFLMDDLPAAFDILPMQAYVDALPDYDLFPEWISNWGYGNIQKHRNRMFIVGALKTEKFVFVPGEAIHDLVMRDVIHDLVTSAGDGTIPNHGNIDPDFIPGRYVNMMAYGDRYTWKELNQLFQNGEWSKNLKYYSPSGEQKIRPGTNNPKWDGTCPVLSGGYNPLHPIRKLPLSVRERARIQGFPDSFIFHFDEEGPGRQVWEPYNSDGQRGIKQTGKAMPLQFCTFVADQVKHHIQGKPFKCTADRVIKPNPKVSQAKLDFCTISGYADQSGACSHCWRKESCDLLATKST